MTSARPLRDLRRRIWERLRTERPGPWLRLTALARSGGDAARRRLGAAALGTAHRVLAALALPPLAALCVGRLAQLPAPAPAVARRARRCSALAALVTAPGAAPRARSHGLRGHARRRGLSVPRRAPSPLGSVRDYVTLTKPRIMTLLLLTGVCGMVVGARRAAAARARSRRPWPGWRSPAAARARSTTCSTATSTG